MQVALLANVVGRKIGTPSRGGIFSPAAVVVRFLLFIPAKSFLQILLSPSLTRTLVFRPREATLSSRRTCRESRLPLRNEKWSKLVNLPQRRWYEYELAEGDGFDSELNVAPLEEDGAETGKDGNSTEEQPETLPPWYVHAPRILSLKSYQSVAPTI